MIMRIVTIMTLYLSLPTKTLNPSTNIAENVAHLPLGPGRNLIIVKRKLAIMGISAIKNIDESEDVEKKIRILISWEYPSKKKGRSARIPPNL